MRSIAPSLALLALSCAGCGNNYHAKAPSSSAHPETIAYVKDSGLERYASYTCPKTPNVEPDYDFEMTGAGYYRVCQSGVSAFEIAVRGKTVKDSAICFFPAQYVDASHVYLKPDKAGTGPLYACASVESGKPVSFTFSGTNFNSAFIVESSGFQKMWSCLKSGNYYQCPHYSFGQFR